MPEKLSTLSGAKKLYDNLNQKIKTEVTEREQALTDANLALEQEVQARKNADNTLQKNINEEKSNREEALLEEAQQRTLDIQTEANSRLNADSELSNRLNEEIENRAFDVNQLQGQIGNETNARLAADATLSKQINQEILDRKSAITTEQRERQNNDASLKTLIENEGKTRAAQDNTLATNLNTETEARIKADSDEQSARISSDEALKQLVEKEVADRKAAVSSEAKARESIDNSLNQKILNETSVRVEQDQVLNQSIEQNRSEINTALSQEASTRSAADTAILQQLTQERELRTSADTTLQQNINKEADTRYIEDNRLQSSITSIESKIPAQASDSNQLADKAFVNSSISTMASFFKGTFKTYAALMEVRWQTTDPEGSNYVHNGDYAYVESDETHNGESWRYIYVLDPDSEDNGWQAQLKMNDTPFTQAQLDSINSGITKNAVNQITLNTNNISSVSTRLTTHAEDQNNPHFVTKEQVGLGNVDNTADADKPVSKATEAAINVNTLRINEHIADKDNPHNVTLKQLGIDSFAGYTPQTMPVSTAQEAAITAVGDVLQAHINVNTNPNPHQITKAKVGLGNVDNTSDKDKPVSDAVQAALDKKANTESPNFTGIPTAPLPDETSPDNQLATVKYVKDNAGTSGAVSFSIQQELTDSQQQTARDNINAAANYRTNIQTGSGIVTLANSLPLDLHDKYYGSFAQVGTPSLSKFSPITFVQGSIRVNNKNILPKGQSTVINGVTFTVKDDGTIVLSGTAEDQITYIIYQKYLPKAQYVISGCPDGGSSTKYALHLSLYKGSTRVTSADCYDSNTGGVIDTSTYDYNECRVEITVQKDVVCNELTFKPQIERGSIFSLYQSYEERTNIVINEDSQLKALPLGSSIPNNISSSSSLFDGVYDLGTDSNHSYYIADTIENSKEVLYDQKKVIVYRIQEKVFTGNETIIYNNVTTGKERFQYAPESDKLPLLGNSLVLAMSNAFQSASFNDLTDSVKRKNNSVCIEDGTSNDYITFYSSDYTDVASFKEALKTLYTNGTPVKVYYIRQTPITEVADSVEYSAYKGTTQVVCDSVVEPYIKTGYKENVWDLLTQQGEVSQQVANAVTYDAQTATEAQKQQARENIGAVDATYVSTQGGKIDTIKVNNVTQTITDKSVNLNVVTSVNGKNGTVTLNASDVNALPVNTPYVKSVNGKSGEVNIDIPAKTSDLTNDSGFITSSDIPKEVFIATYDTTTFAEIQAAYNAGKICICKQDDKFAHLTKITSTLACFTCVLSSSTAGVWCVNAGDLWMEQSEGYSPKTHASTHASGGSDPITPASIGAAAKSNFVNATLSANNWSGDSAPYTYTLSISDVTTTSNQELLPALNITEEQLTALQAANIQDGGQLTDSITLKAFGDKPTIDIPIRVILRGDA